MPWTNAPRTLLSWQHSRTATWQVHPGSSPCSLHTALSDAQLRFVRHCFYARMFILKGAAGGLWPAYWLEEGAKDKVGDCSELLAEALSILQQYRANPQLQADIKAAHKVTSCAPILSSGKTVGRQPLCMSTATS